MILGELQRWQADEVAETLPFERFLTDEMTLDLYDLLRSRVNDEKWWDGLATDHAEALNRAFQQQLAEVINDPTEVVEHLLAE